MLHIDFKNAKEVEEWVKRVQDENDMLIEELKVLSEINMEGRSSKVRGGNDGTT